MVEVLGKGLDAVEVLGKGLVVVEVVGKGLEDPVEVQSGI